MIKDSATEIGSAALISKKLERIKIHYSEYEKVDGRRRILVGRVNDGSIITRFDKEFFETALCVPISLS